MYELSSEHLAISCQVLHTVLHISGQKLKEENSLSSLLGHLTEFSNSDVGESVEKRVCMGNECNRNLHGHQ